MSPDVGTICLLAIAIAMAVVMWEMQHANKPNYRKGCTECDAAARRVIAEEAERIHDMKHRGVKAPGMPAPDRDRWPCDDPSCPRNPKRW